MSKGLSNSISLLGRSSLVLASGGALVWRPGARVYMPEEKLRSHMKGDKMYGSERSGPERIRRAV